MPWAAMASRLGVSLEGWPKIPRSPQPIYNGENEVKCINKFVQLLQAQTQIIASQSKDVQINMG